MSVRNWAMSVAVEALTDEELVVAPGQDDNVNLNENPSETMEAELVEVQGLDHKIEELVDDGEQLNEDTAGIDKLIGVVEGAGDLDVTTAKVIEIGAEGYCSRWGVSAAKQHRVAAESFGSEETRDAAKVIALEGLKDRAVGLLDTFITWLKELYQRGKDFIVGLTNVGKAMKVRETKLQAAIKAGLGEITTKEVEGSFIADLTVDEKPDYAECLKFASSAASDVDNIGRETKSTMDQAGKMVREFAAVKSDHGQTISSKTVPFGKKLAKKLTGVVPQNATSVELYALPGNGYLTYFVLNNIVHTKYVSQKSKEGKLATLDAAGCKSGADALGVIGDVLETKLKAFRDTNEMFKVLADDLSRAKAAEKDADNDTNKAAAKLAVSQARATVMNAKQSEKAVTDSLKAAGKGIAGYVTASINAHGKAAPAAGGTKEAA